MKKDANIITTLSLVSITILSGVILASSSTAADNDSAVTNASVTVPVSCIMSSSVDTAHNATLSPGTYSGASGSQYENGIGKTTLTTYCNDNNGFSIYAIGFTGDSYDSENHTKLVGTSASNNATIPTKVYELSDTASNWSMKVTKVENPSQGDPITYNPQNMSITNSFNSWHVIPDTYTKVAEYHATTGSSATDTALGAKVETTYASYIAPTQAADTYTGKVKYTMVHPYNKEAPIPDKPGQITYRKNADDALGVMGNQSATDGASVTLYASNFSREGYGFAGWSDKEDFLTNPEAKFYGPNENITVPQGTTANGFSLYAMWIPSAGSIQDSSKVASLCGTGVGSLTKAPIDGSVDLSSVTALTDQRDGQVYTIAKLADGQCWMTENLRINDTPELSASNTHNPLLPLVNNYSSNTTSNHLTSSSEYWCNNTTNDCVDQSLLNTSNTTYYRSNTASNQSSNIYSYGNYYNWYSATAGRGKLNTTSSTTLTGDICPFGWRLPKGHNAGEDFEGLDLALGGTGSGQSTQEASNRWRKFPNNYLLSGIHYASTTASRGTAGVYYTATVNWDDWATTWRLQIGETSVDPGTDEQAFKRFGQSVRCIFDN